MCSGRPILLKLAFRASFSLVRFFWRNKRNEQIIVGKPKNRSPKIICSLDFCSQFLLFFKGVRELALRARFFGYFLFIKKKKVTWICGEQKMNKINFKTKKVTN